MEHFGYLLENEIFWRGLHGYEPQSMGVWTTLAARSNVILDVGANTGVYSLVAKAVNPGARVIAFEPVQRIYDKFVHNIALNGFDIDARSIALSDETGEAIFFDPMTEHTYSVTLNRNLHPEVPSQEVAVRRVTLDDFIRDERLDRVDLIKIDVELHEAEVLSGFRECMRRFQPAMLVEVIDDDVATRLNDLLAGTGYRYYVVDETAGLLRPVTSIVRSGRGLGTNTNMLVCTAATAGALGVA